VQTVQATLRRHPETLLADIAARRLPRPGDGRSFCVEACVDPAPFPRLVEPDRRQVYSPPTPNALKVMSVYVSFTPRSVWIFSVTKSPTSWSGSR
jgi:hypothetical protein